MKSSILTLSIVLFLSSGCTSMMDSIADANQQTWRALKPKAFDSDWSSGGEEEIDQWGFVGEEARGDRPKESDPDPWWQKYVMSSKARNIERNLGIE
ncbi:hypothetical protein [Gimesia aquarii]|uniref:Lipoprotein n=1 Tax=Gimesia aquarii TaxID=2527964 RepID=A0A517WYX6_9PLAN|nr:hypothetical protein [Gimesia aquarii]QDU10441.1 hypothetical protein V202x_38510 [Gimesia aquarii]